MFNARALIRSGPEAAATIARYQEQTDNNNASDAEQLRQPISASEVDE
ncbi:unnamed protein product, partial [Ectocarpus fasciculatus]